MGGQKIKLIEKGGYCSFNWGCYIIKLDRGGVIQLGGGVKKKLHPPPPTPRFLKEYPLILCSILRFKKLKLAWSFLETPKMFHLQVFLFFEINMYQLSWRIIQCGINCWKCWLILQLMQISHPVCRRSGERLASNLAHMQLGELRRVLHLQIILVCIIRDKNIPLIYSHTVNLILQKHVLIPVILSK